MAQPSDAQPDEAQSVGILYEPPVFGSGEMPAELARLNWSAGLWGWLWALLYGIWPWFWLLLAAWAVGRVGTALVLSGVASGPTGIAIAIASEIVIWVPSVYFGFRANRILWDRAASGGNTFVMRAADRPLAEWTLGQRMGAYAGLSFAALAYLLALGSTLGNPGDGAASVLAAFGTAFVVLGGAGLIDLARERSRRRKMGLPEA